MTATNDKKYCYAYEEDGIYYEDDGSDPAYLWMGEVRKYTHDDLVYFDEHSFLNNLQEHLLEEYGELTENYIPDMTREQLDRLNQAVKAVILKWMDENIPQPTFFTAENVLPIQELIK